MYANPSRSKGALLLLLSLAVVATGNADLVVAESPERAAQEGKSWHKKVDSRFDLPALREFLRKTIAEMKQVEGVDITRSRLDKKWRSAGNSALRCGDWIFTMVGDDDRFELLYIYADPKYLTLKCARQSNDSFRLLAAARDEIVALHDAEPRPTKTIKVMIEFTVGHDGTPQKIAFVEPTEKKYEESILTAVAQWRLPKEYAGKRVRQPFEFVEEVEKNVSDPAAPVTSR